MPAHPSVAAIALKGLARYEQSGCLQFYRVRGRSQGHLAHVDPFRDSQGVADFVQWETPKLLGVSAESFRAVQASQ
jgi:hypothetical protein